MQTPADGEIAGIVNGGLGAQRLAFLVVLLDAAALVVDVQRRGDPVGDDAGGRRWPTSGDPAIRYVTPAQRHAGEDTAILAARHALYQQARERNLARWSGETRNWSPITSVALNPEREACVAPNSSGATTKQRLAA